METPTLKDAVTQKHPNYPVAWVTGALIVGLLIGGVGGYWFGYDHGFEKIAGEDIVSEEFMGEEVFEPVVVFTPSGRFTEVVRAQILARVIRPFLDYDRQSAFPSNYVSVQVEVSLDGIYTYFAIGEHGVTRGAVIGQTNGQFDWWYPTCLGDCPFTEEYRAKYPEVVGQ